MNVILHIVSSEAVEVSLFYSGGHGYIVRLFQRCDHAGDVFKHPYKLERILNKDFTLPSKNTDVIFRYDMVLFYWHASKQWSFIQLLFYFREFDYFVRLLQCWDHAGDIKHP